MPARPALATGAVPSGTGPVAERREVGTGMARREIPFIGPAVSDPATPLCGLRRGVRGVHPIAHGAPRRISLTNGKRSAASLPAAADETRRLTIVSRETN
jgi:hypothetical protein